jgi:NAD(P) transhydrogenase subunit beta
MGSNILAICYLIASVSFILGLKMLSNPLTARRGNLIAAGGMSIAIIATIFLYETDGRYLRNYPWIFSGILIGSIIGTFSAKKVKMTAMPEMVSLFNGMGGACAALISIAEFGRMTNNPLGQISVAFHPALSAFSRLAEIHIPQTSGELLIILLGLIIGSVSFAGSVIAWGKLNGTIKDIAFKGQHLANLFFLLLILAAAGYLLWNLHSGSRISLDGEVPEHLKLHLLTSTWVSVLFYSIFILALVYGILFVLPIGGADMPVVISLLNSFTGVAAACGGLLYDNKAMLTGGILVGASGTLLTILMCKAMNRSLKNVLVGSFGGHAVDLPAGKSIQGVIKEISISDAAMVMAYAKKMMIVPGYGLAVAQAQHTCRDLEKLLTEKGVDVKYAIHPVAGRMPGHMNVLLAEADVSYDQLLEMDQANELFPTTDVVLILGANDVVNPAAKTDPSSPIYGMPILDVQLAKMVIVNKRSMKPGYAGIENALFFQPKTSMLFGDAKIILQQLIAEIKNI